MNISFEYSRIPHLTKYSTNAQSKSKLIDQSCLVRNSIAIFTSQIDYSVSAQLHHAAWQRIRVACFLSHDSIRA